jgi:hypothetical protein
MNEIKKDDLRVGLTNLSPLKNPIKWINSKRYERAHKLFHNNNKSFYPTTPMLLEGIIKAIDIQIKANKINGYGYWEFGVFKGFSMWFTQMYARTKGVKDFEYYGFDSFAGLPHSKIDSVKPAFREGHYQSPYEFVTNIFKTLDFSPEKMRLFKGFYSEELFKNITQENKLLPISICVIDVDIYESTVEVLEFIKDHLIVGSIILFDDFNCFLKSDEHGERKALIEFKNKYPNFEFKPLFGFGWHGEVFEVVKK